MLVETFSDKLLALPIFHKSYDFIVVSSDYITKFPKKDRYAIGARIENISFDFLILIMRANYDTDSARANSLNEASFLLDALKIFVRLAKDKRALQMNQYILLEERLQDIGRQLGGWLKSTRDPFNAGPS